MKFKRRPMGELSVNITPLIDVVFLLLIFFMVTTTFNRETRLLVNLPEADAAELEATPEQIEITVSREGSYLINGRSLVNNELETLMQGLQLVSNGDNTVPVLLIADADTSHQSVVTAMDGLGRLGFTRLSIATQRSEDPATTTTP